MPEWAAWRWTRAKQASTTWKRSNATHGLPVASPADQLRFVHAELSELAERRERVEQALTSAAGGASLCSISRSAGPVPGIKYLEGQMAALMELERAARRGEGLVSASAEILDRWSARLDGARQRGMSADWIAYYAGGVDELTAASGT